MREYSNKIDNKKLENLNSDLTKQPSCICDFLDSHFYEVIIITTLYLFLCPKILNFFINKNSEILKINYNHNFDYSNTIGICKKMGIEDIDLNSQSSVIKYFTLNFLELFLECSDKVLSDSWNIFNSSDAFFKFLKLFFNQNTINSFCSDIPDSLKSEYIRFFENLKLCESYEDFNEICNKKEYIIRIVSFIKKTYKINV